MMQIWSVRLLLLPAFAAWAWAAQPLHAQEDAICTIPAACITLEIPETMSLASG